MHERMKNACSTGKEVRDEIMSRPVI